MSKLKLPLRKTHFKEDKNAIIEAAIKKNACTEEVSAAVNAYNYELFVEVVRRNYHWLSNKNIIVDCEDIKRLTAKEWFSLFPEEIREKLNNIPIINGSEEKRYVRPFDALNYSFVWSGTEEGHAYWDNIYEQLRQGSLKIE
jgi:hypothetical protein